jgi:predicted enzyme related to lactoylglutathione lyase
MGHPVTHFEINARDAKATQKFYGDLFGWRINTNNPMDYGMVDTAAKGHGINGGIGATQTGRSWVTFYVDTDDLQETLATAERLGGRTVMPPVEMGPTSFALFADPEGNVVGIAKSTDQQPARKPKRATTRKATARRSTRKTTARKRTAPKKRTTRRLRR